MSDEGTMKKSEKVHSIWIRDNYLMIKLYTGEVLKCNIEESVIDTEYDDDLNKIGKLTAHVSVVGSIIESTIFEKD